MAIWNWFGGASAQKLEQKGDALFRAEKWGLAKIEYEHALQKSAQASDASPAKCNELEHKIALAREALARQHAQEAQDYLDGGYYEEAGEMLQLAIETSTEASFQSELKQQLQGLEAQRQKAAMADLPDPLYGLGEQEGHQDSAVAEWHDIDDDEYFAALCGTLPDAVREEYQRYGADFQAGYIALNRGDFEDAAHWLARALSTDRDPPNFISLELATAYFNLGRMEEARGLLERFVEYHPEALPAYQLLCEIYWEQKAFDRVDALLESIPVELADSLAVVRLKGETLYQEGRYALVKDFYTAFLATYGWHETIARDLARAHEALGEGPQARLLYGEIMAQCTSCHSRIDPVIKHKYAELSFAEGLRDSDTLELYLALAREIPDNAAAYFNRISSIYSHQGNRSEADRFRAFAVRAGYQPDDQD